MPVLTSRLHPVRAIRNRHIQTVCGALWPVFPGGAPFRRERMELADGDFLDLDWLDTGSADTAVLCHGLEGSSRNRYVRRMAYCLAADGWNILAWNYRGCGGTPNRLLRAYHSGDSGDLHALLGHAFADHRGKVVLVGFSLGGNLALKYAAEPGTIPNLAGVAALSAPVDLASSVRALEGRFSSRLYVRRMIRSLRCKVTDKARRFPTEINLNTLRTCTGFSDFDEHFTAPIHGFRSAGDYWQRSSAGPLLAHIRIPSLLLNARDDPFLGAGCFPFQTAAASRWLHLEAPLHGGHLGFVDTLGGRFTWGERRCRDFLRGIEGESQLPAI